MDKMREEFESWYESRFGDSKLIWLQSVQEYDYTSVQCMWQAWKASRAALTNELQQRNAELAAQVVLIRDAISAVRDSSYTKGFGYPDTSQLKAQSEAWQELNEVLEATPAQCLAVHDAEIKAQAVRDVMAPLSDEDLNLLICNADDGDWNSLMYRDCWAKGFAEGVREREAINQERLVANGGE